MPRALDCSRSFRPWNSRLHVGVCWDHLLPAWLEASTYRPFIRDPAVPLWLCHVPAAPPVSPTTSCGLQGGNSSSGLSAVEDGSGAVWNGDLIVEVGGWVWGGVEGVGGVGGGFWEGSVGGEGDGVSGGGVWDRGSQASHLIRHKKDSNPW